MILPALELIAGWVGVCAVVLALYVVLAAIGDDPPFMDRE
jgi:hypothetical protein